MKLSKAGFTLMELIVYMGIVGIVVVIAGQAFSSSTKFRIRTDNMIKATQEAENVAMLFKTDVEQMGAKISKETIVPVAGSNDVFSATTDAQDVYINYGTDQSSYNLAAGTDYDELSFRRFRFDDNGRYSAVEEVGWFVKDDTLKRYCRTISGEEDEYHVCLKGVTVAVAKQNSVAMANGVKKFLVTPAMPGVHHDNIAQIFPSCSAEPCSQEFRMVSRTGSVAGGGDYLGLSIALDESNHRNVTLAGFVSNYDNSTNALAGAAEAAPKVNQVFAIENTDGLGSWSARCSETGNHFTLEPNIEYEIAFSLLNNAHYERTFVSGKDHMAVGFRTQEGVKPAGVDDFMFFPPISDQSSGVRRMRFTVPHRIENVCIAFTFACYSPLVSRGRITISDLSLKKVETSNYFFDYSESKEFSVKDKAKVKAFRLQLQVSRGAKNGASGETGNVDLIIPTPSNGVSD
ncbi:type II secretion system protein [Candidatus Saccharibacteria bacterium]|nr:type II secretion system protein [Candidatus Saccharibacteria bacterium]